RLAEAKRRREAGPHDCSARSAVSALNVAPCARGTQRQRRPLRNTVRSLRPLRPLRSIVTLALRHTDPLAVERRRVDRPPSRMRRLFEAVAEREQLRLTERRSEE